METRDKAEQNRFQNLTYQVLTEKSVLDMEKSELEDLYQEQCRLLPDGYYVIHVFEDPRYLSEKYLLTESPLITAGEILALKEGLDVVRFSPGKAGVIGYYGSNANAMEFLPITKEVYENLQDGDERYLQACFEHLGFAYCYKEPKKKEEMRKQD